MFDSGRALVKGETALSFPNLNLSDLDDSLYLLERMQLSQLKYLNYRQKPEL